MIEHYIDSALVIDDKESEIEGLKKLLEENDIWVRHLLPEVAKKSNGLKIRKILFLDLFLSRTSGNDIEGHLSEIRKILQQIIGNQLGNYGIVLWSAHVEEIEKLKKKISIDIKNGTYTMPLFIVGLDKTKYLRQGFSTLFSDLDGEISKNPAASFFIQWSQLVKEGKENAIGGIYSLVKDYDKQDELLKYILYKMAENYTGIPRAQSAKYPFDPDAYKAFADILHYEIANKSESTEIQIFTDPAAIQSYNNENINKETLYSQINTKMFLDFNNLNSDYPIPGNVYEIEDSKNFFVIENAPSGCKSILLEITPPCDFSQNKKVGRSRVVGGFICDYSSSAHKFHSDNYYKEIYPMKLNGFEKPQMIIFDFRYFGSVTESDLKNKSLYKLAFRLKDKLFADVLQKLSSHTARLGLSIIHT